MTNSQSVQRHNRTIVTTLFHIRSNTNINPATFIIICTRSPITEPRTFITRSGRNIGRTIGPISQPRIHINLITSIFINNRGTPTAIVSISHYVQIITFLASNINIGTIRRTHGPILWTLPTQRTYLIIPTVARKG